MSRFGNNPDTLDLKECRSELLALPGVQEVALTTSTEPQDSVEASMVSNRESAQIARSLLHDRYPEVTPLNPVWYIETDVWNEMIDRASARDTIDGWLSRGAYAEVAEHPHQSWRASKDAARVDPLNPYQGWGEKRIKVRDLSPGELRDLGIEEEADPLADVYHPLDAPLAELDASVRTRNFVPVVSLLNAMSDYLLTDDSSVGELASLVGALESGTVPDKTDIINAAVHIGWMAMDLSFDGSPEKTPENYHTFSRLDPATRALDTGAASSVYEGLRSSVLSPYELWGSIISSGK